MTTRANLINVLRADRMALEECTKFTTEIVLFLHLLYGVIYFRENHLG